MTTSLHALTLCFALTASVAQARAEASSHPATDTQVALLVGVLDYGGPNVDLASPGLDVEGVRGALDRIGGFDVRTLLDPDRESLIAALLDARERAFGGVVFFYFSGHAISLDGVNYLLPARTVVKTPGEVPLRGVSVQQVLGALDGARLRLVVLDACRSNAFAVGGKAVGSSGLSRDQLAGYEGTLVSYAAAPGSVAYDGGEGHMSPFTKALVHHLPTPGLDLLNLFTRVRGELRASTAHLPRGPQRSEEINSLVTGENFALVPRAETAGEKAAAPPVRAPPPSSTTAASSVDDASSPWPLVTLGAAGAVALVGVVVGLAGAALATWAEVTLGDVTAGSSSRTLALTVGGPALAVAVVGGVVGALGLTGAAVGGALLATE